MFRYDVYCKLVITLVLRDVEPLEKSKRSANSIVCNTVYLIWQYFISRLYTLHVNISD